MIFFGLTEPEQESQDQLRNKVMEILEELDCDTVPKVRRLGVGASKASPARPRPVQVTLYSSAEVHEVLKLGKQLKKSDWYFEVYITLDRTPDQQKKHKQMVEKLKEKIKEMPERKFYILHWTPAAPYLYLFILILYMYFVQCNTLLYYYYDSCFYF